VIPLEVFGFLASQATHWLTSGLFSSKHTEHDQVPGNLLNFNNGLPASPDSGLSFSAAFVGEIDGIRLKRGKAVAATGVAAVLAAG
jgi:hypothetical protein